MRRSASAAFLVCTLGIASYSTMDAFMKGLVRAIGVYDAILWRGVAGCVLSGALFAWKRPAWPARRVLRMHVVRGVLITVMALLFFWGLARMPIAQAVALTFIAPLISLGLAAVLLKERIGLATVLASLVALSGVLVILAGQALSDAGPEATLGAAAVLVSAMCYALNIILMRQQALSANPIEITFFQNIVLTATLALAAPFLAELPPAETIAPLLATTVLAVLSALLLAWAYARAEASYLSATEYTAFVWSALLGYLVFGERLSGYTLAGAALIVGGCLIAAWRKPLPPLANAEAAS